MAIFVLLNHRCVSFQVFLTMVEVNGSESFLNAANTTLFSFAFCTGSYPPKSVKITLYSILLALSLIGNLLIVALFYRNKTLRTTVHYFIVNMAISDLIMPLIYLPLVISEVYHDGLWLMDGLLGALLCKLIWFAWDLSTYVSILSMMGAAADRFYAVLFPMKSALFSRNKRRLIIAATWVVSVTFQAHYLYTVEIVFNANGNYCDIPWDPASYKFEVFRTNSILVFYLTAVSAVVITVLYSSILFFLYRRKNNLDLGTEVIRRRVKTNQQISRMLVIIVAAFYIVWTPFYVVYYIISFMHSIKISCFYFSFCSNLPLLYPVVNPVVYYKFNANYRQGFRELLCCPWPCSTKCNEMVKNTLYLKKSARTVAHEYQKVNSE